MKISTAGLAIFFFAAIALHAETTNDPVAQLAAIPAFAFGPVGAAGIPSEGELAFKEIMARPSAEKDFLQLLKTRSHAAQCYAIAGLHAINPELAKVQAEPFASSREKIETIEGCMIANEIMQAVVSNILAGAYDFAIQPKK